MRISFSNPTLSFGAKNANTRKADDIQRRARATFPMLSATYADEFYKSSKSDSKYKKRADKASDDLQQRILALREKSDYPRAFGIDVPISEIGVPYTHYLKNIKKSGIGNCKENAMAAVAALCANGIYRAKRAELALEVNFVDIITNEVVHTDIVGLDHSFAVADMDGNDDYETVVDPWLGFASDKKDAVSRYKQLYTERELNEHIGFCFSMFRLREVHKMVDKGLLPDYKMSRYKTESRIIFKDVDDFTEEELQALGDFAREQFPEIVIEKKKTKQQKP